MTESVGVSGAYKTAAAQWIGVSGAWRLVTAKWIGAGGSWRQFFTSLTPFTNTYTSGSGTETVPTGAQSLTITLYGIGGYGGSVGTLFGGGGGGGGKSVKTISIASSDWGSGLAYSIGTAPGTTVSGTLAAGSVSMTAKNGLKGGDGDNVVGTGGTASGGDTNLSGSDGGDGGANYYYGGAAASGGGARQTTPNADGNAPGGGGAGGIHDGEEGGAGGHGQASFAWS